MRILLFMTYLLFITSLLLFSIFELFPDLLHWVNLERIPYYFVKTELREDSSLVFTPRLGERVIEFEDFRGDMYSPAYGVEVPVIKYRASYDRNGFRTNSSIPPVDILVIGDSFVEIGESDESTFSEILKQTSGLSTLNLGRGWYGPPQYLELLKRYGLTMKAKYAFLCFFDGNDTEDTRQYRDWQRGEGYYHFVSSNKNFFKRYLIVLHQISSLLRNWIRDHFVLMPGIHPELALIQLDSQIVPMRFDSWNRDATADLLLRTEEWETLLTVLTQFRTVALDNGMSPIILFIPTKAEVYGSFFSDRSGERFLQKIDKQLRFETNSLEALQTITKDLNIEFVNLLPHFKKLAKQGKVLYYPFDTHWNIAGRQAAAEFLTGVVIRQGKRAEE